MVQQVLEPLIRGQVHSLPGQHRQFVAAAIFRVFVVALDPTERDLVSFCEFQEFLPEVGILGRLLGCRGPPPVAPPSYDIPPVQVIHHILGIAVDRGRDLWFLDVPKGYDDGQELHAVVGGVPETAGKLLPVPVSGSVATVGKVPAAVIAPS